MKEYNYTFLLSICSVAALGGFLFGYDWVVIGGAKPFYELYLNCILGFQKAPDYKDGR